MYNKKNKHKQTNTLILVQIILNVSAIVIRLMLHVWGLQLFLNLQRCAIDNRPRLLCMFVCFSSTLCCSFSVFVTNKDYYHAMHKIDCILLNSNLMRCSSFIEDLECEEDEDAVGDVGKYLPAQLAHLHSSCVFWVLCLSDCCLIARYL